MPPAFTLSQDQTLRFISVPASLPEDIAVQRQRHQDINEQTRTLWFAPIALTFATANRNSFKAYCNASKRYETERLKAKTNEIQVLLKPRPPVRPLDQPRARARDPRAPPTYPFLAYTTVKEPERRHPCTRKNGPFG